MKQFIKFCIVGVTNTIVSYTTYMIVLYLLRTLEFSEKYDYFLASFIAFVLSVLWSFYWNNRITFELSDTSFFAMWRALVKTYICYSATGVFLNNCLLYVWVEGYAVPKEVAPIINIIITVPANFLLNKIWVYGSTKE